MNTVKWIESAGVWRCEELNAQIFHDAQRKHSGTPFLYQIWIPGNGCVSGRAVSVKSAMNRVHRTITHCAELERKINDSE